MRALLKTLPFALLIASAHIYGVPAVDNQTSHIEGVIEIQPAAPGSKRHAPTKPIALAWSAISGGFSGESSLSFFAAMPEKFARSTADNEASFSAEVSMAQEALERSATHATEALFNIQPSDTRIARMATTGFVPLRSETRLPAEFRDPKTNRALIAFYVDRPCHISGRLPLGQASERTWWTYDLDVPSAGLHWAEVRSDKEKSSLTLVPLPRKIVYVISASGEM